MKTVLLFGLISIALAIREAAYLPPISSDNINMLSYCLVAAILSDIWVGVTKWTQ